MKFLLYSLAWFLVSNEVQSYPNQDDLDKEEIAIANEIQAFGPIAARKAIDEALASGSSVLIARNGFLVEIFPDGTEKTIKQLPPSHSLRILENI